MFLLQVYNQNIVKNYQNVLAKYFEKLVYCNEYKIKSENKNTTNEYRYSKTKLHS